jgi:ribA/ribD-fused uncharacterized protein
MPHPSRSDRLRNIGRCACGGRVVGQYGYGRDAASAHDAFRLAQNNKHRQRSDWDSIKVGVMREILHAKAAQHEYVRRKLLETGTRELVEDSWRDSFWGSGPDGKGKNMLGKLWMEVREALAAIDKLKGGDKT